MRVIDWPGCRFGILALLYSHGWVSSTPGGRETGEDRTKGVASAPSGLQQRGFGGRRLACSVTGS